MTASSQVLATLGRLSEAWRNRRYAELEGLFDERVIVILPGFAGRLEGREALVRSYQEFMERASLEEYREDTPTIDTWADTAVAYYHWSMTWTAGGKTERGSGHDLFV